MPAYTNRSPASGQVCGFECEYVAVLQVQRAAAGALRTLAFKNEDNKNQIVECGALPTLIHMLRAQDAGIHYEAVGVIGNLVHSSIHIKRTVCGHCPQ